MTLLCVKINSGKKENFGSYTKRSNKRIELCILRGTGITRELEELLSLDFRGGCYYDVMCKCKGLMKVCVMGQSKKKVSSFR